MTMEPFQMAKKGCVFAAGFVSNRSLGGADLDEGFGAVLIGILLGAFIGLIVGLLSSNLLRFAAYITGRHVSGNAWTICSIVLGAIVFGLLAAFGGTEAEPVPDGKEGLARN